MANTEPYEFVFLLFKNLKKKKKMGNEKDDC